MPSLSNFFFVVAAAAPALFLPTSSSSSPSSPSSSQAVSYAAHHFHYSEGGAEDNPTRINSAAESIDQRLRRRRRHKDNDQIYRNDGSGSDELSSSLLEEGGTSSSTENNLPQHTTNSLIEDLVFSPRIIGGTASTPNQYPYLVSLTYFGSHICGGSLVAKDMVLSAAHCAGFATSVELGRYDKTIPYNETIHETIDVAYEIKHPLWDSATVDNDFMLMKLVHPSILIEEQRRKDIRISLIQLNTDPNVPSISGEKLTIMGWGDTNADPDLLEPSMQVLETQLEYVPNNVCALKEGLVDGEEVQYDSTLTENMMCAMDEDGVGEGAPVDEDTCSGDSGSPVIIRLSNGEDVQVGIVSMGIGCASPIFPGIYSRVSSQYEWIRETVCQYSHTAPTSFQCDATSSNVTGVEFLSEEDESDEFHPYVTLEISLDEKPEEFSWIVSPLLSGKNINQVAATIPPGFYSGYSNYTFHHKIQVSHDHFYRISLRDSLGDGMKGYVAVYRGMALMSNLIMHEQLFYDKNRANTKRLDHAFYTGLVPQNYFSLKIKFDNFPDDLYWKLESVTDSLILAQRPIGWYNERFKLMTIVEKIPVFEANTNVNPQYRFTIGDSYPCDDDPTEVCGDGICCEYGNGKFELFAGTVEDGNILTSGGDYGLVHSVLITLPRSSISL